MRDKIRRAERFAELTFPEDVHRYEIWSPVVSVGRLTKAFEELGKEFSDADLDVKFITNELYSKRILELVEHARINSTATSEPAYRLLQILTRLRGDWRV